MLQIPNIEDHPLKELLRERGLSQIRLARLLGVSQSTLSQWLSGYRPPPPGMKERLEELRDMISQEKIVC